MKVKYYLDEDELHYLTIELGMFKDGCEGHEDTHQVVKNIARFIENLLNSRKE